MAVVEFLADDVEKLTGLPREKIIEEMGNLGAPTECTNDGKLIVEVTPIRPVFFFIEGICRALNCYLNNKKYEYKTEKSKYAMISDRSVVGVRPFVRAAVVMGISLNAKILEYLIEAQEKIHDTVGRKRKKVAIGIHNLDVIEFPLIYRAVDEAEFVPLGVAKEMNVIEILEKHQKGKEYAHLVKNKYPMIFDKKGVVSFPPIINSERTKVDEKTTNLLIDVTGTHEETVDMVLNMLVCTLADRGGKIVEVKINGEPYPNLIPKKMKLDVKFLGKTLGIKLKGEEIKNYLGKMGFQMTGSNVLVPPYRIDIMHEVDLVEDVAIAYGYNKLPKTLPNFFTSGSLNRKETELEEILRNMSFLEIKTFTLTNNKKISSSGLDVVGTPVSNPASEEYAVLRPSLLPSFLEVISINKTRGMPQRLYEIGDLYDGNKIRRVLMFVIVDRKVMFSDLRGYLQSFMNELGIKFEIKTNIDQKMQNGMSGDIITNRIVGEIGCLSPNVLKNNNIDFEIGVCEICLDELMKK